jgi:chorismate mutase
MIAYTFYAPRARFSAVTSDAPIFAKRPICIRDRILWTDDKIEVTHMSKLYAERAALAQELAQIKWQIEYEQSRETLLRHELAKKRKKGKKKPRY